MQDVAFPVAFDDRAVGNDDLVQDDLHRLKQRFDPLLQDWTLALDSEAQGELLMLARIYDLDERLAPSELWGALRLLLHPTPLAA